MSKLSEFQARLKAPKNQFNKFGGYKYRSAEDIIEAVKLVINPSGFHLNISDEIILIGDRYYIKATAMITDGKETYSSTAYAREEESRKGMDGSQITGSASSYARKYALNGLFAIDDTKDADATNDHAEKTEVKPLPKLKSLTPKDKNWNQAVEYAATNGITPILKKYTISKEDQDIMSEHIEMLNIEAHERSIQL